MCGHGKIGHSAAPLIFSLPDGVRLRLRADPERDLFGTSCILCSRWIHPLDGLGCFTSYCTSKATLIVPGAMQDCLRRPAVRWPPACRNPVHLEYLFWPGSECHCFNMDRSDSTLYVIYRLPCPCLLTYLICAAESLDIWDIEPDITNDLIVFSSRYTATG